MNYSSRLASKMQQFDTEETLPHLIRHSYIVENFDKELTQKMSELLTDPKNVNIYLRSKTFEASPDLCPI
jgi:secreted Zn-dependent insulinase-like peptidase